MVNIKQFGKTLKGGKRGKKASQTCPIGLLPYNIEFGSFTNGDAKLYLTE